MSELCLHIMSSTLCVVDFLAEVSSVLIPVQFTYAGVMFAMFVGTVATTLTFASLGLVAVASGAGTTAAAGWWT